MASVVPSTMGTLMASGIMSGGKKTAGKEKLDAPGYLLFLQGFAEGIAKRGKCVRGERTVLDAVGEAGNCLFPRRQRLQPAAPWRAWRRRNPWNPSTERRPFTRRQPWEHRIRGRTQDILCSKGWRTF